MLYTFRDLAPSARALLNDVPAEVFADDVLLPLANVVYQDIQTRLAQSGISTQSKTETLVVPADTTALDDSSTPALPDTLVVPLQLSERPSGTSERFTPIDYMPRLPEVEAGDRLRFWSWESSQVLFIGANRSIDVRLKYEQQLAELDLLGDVKSQIRGALLCHQLGTAYQAAASHKDYQALAPGLDEEYSAKLRRLIDRTLRPYQRRTYRRRPYGYRRHLGRLNRY